jgi:hypothetical protein
MNQAFELEAADITAGTPSIVQQTTFRTLWERHPPLKERRGYRQH